MLHSIQIPTPNNQDQIKKGFLGVMKDIARTMEVSPGKTEYSVSEMNLHPDIVRHVQDAMILCGWIVKATPCSLQIKAALLTSTFRR